MILCDKAQEITDWGQIALSVPGLAEKELARHALSAEDVNKIRGRVNIPNNRIIIVGHYWQTGIIEKKTDQVICVDYSVAEDRELVCFSYEEGSEEGSGTFVSTR